MPHRSVAEGADRAGERGALRFSFLNAFLLTRWPITVRAVIERLDSKSEYRVYGLVKGLAVFQSVLCFYALAVLFLVSVSRVG